MASTMPWPKAELTLIPPTGHPPASLQPTPPLVPPPLTGAAGEMGEGAVVAANKSAPLTTGVNGAREVAGAAGTRTVDAGAAEAEEAEAAAEAEAEAEAAVEAEAEAEVEKEPMAEAEAVAAAAAVISTAPSEKRTPLGGARHLGRASTDRLARGCAGGSGGGGRPARSIASSVAISGALSEAEGWLRGAPPPPPSAPSRTGLP